MRDLFNAVANAQYHQWESVEVNPVPPSIQTQSLNLDNCRLTKINICQIKDPMLKEEFHTNHQKYRNLLSTLLKKSKYAYYDKYFEKKLE